MPVAVPIVAGTAIRGVAATVMMRSVLERHPNAFLITLAHFGVAMSLDRSQEHIHADIEAGLEAQGRAPGSPSSSSDTPRAAWRHCVTRSTTRTR